MIIRSLTVVLEEAELAAKLREGLVAVSQVRDLTFGLSPGAASVGGTLQLGLSLPFETRWTVGLLEQGRRVSVRLAHVSVGLFGMGAGRVTAQVMAALAEKLQGVPGVTVEDGAISLDPAVLLAAKGVRLDAPVKRIAVLQGCVEIEV